MQVFSVAQQPRPLSVLIFSSRFCPTLSLERPYVDTVTHWPAHCQETHEVKTILSSLIKLVLQSETTTISVLLLLTLLSMVLSLNSHLSRR